MAVRIYHIKHSLVYMLFICCNHGKVFTSLLYHVYCMFILIIIKPFHIFMGHHTIIWICPSVCLLAIFSIVSGPIDPKLGRKVGDYKMTISLYVWDSGWESYWQGSSIKNIIFTMIFDVTHNYYIFVYHYHCIWLIFSLLHVGMVQAGGVLCTCRGIQLTALI